MIMEGIGDEMAKRSGGGDDGLEMAFVACLWHPGDGVVAEGKACFEVGRRWGAIVVGWEVLWIMVVKGRKLGKGVVCGNVVHKGGIDGVVVGFQMMNIHGSVERLIMDILGI
ncbi:unnamed protein product [Sphenostylis stenocarpa]|uniref:Uncharacterized protein n=1 Tax=Sphenostylis stenocarpa TaxID=92480 RepID=A0AA86T7K4_9FABA|nr:unnamed protein product [Sphenostylis stenocarpa]